MTEAKRITVVDALNPKRVLGTMPRPSGRLRDYYQAVITSPLTLSWKDYNAAHDVFVRTIHFRPIFIDTDGGWAKEAVMATSSPLSDLMQWRDFRLEGESELQAGLRLCRAGIL